MCGAHVLERKGEMKSQKIRKSGLFDAVDKRGVLVEKVEQEWSLDHTPNVEEKYELMIPHNVLIFLFAKVITTFRCNIIIIIIRPIISSVCNARLMYLFIAIYACKLC